MTVLADQIAAAGLIPGRSPEPVLLPDPVKLFTRRAERLRTLAPGHAMGSWLAFVADIAEAQQALAHAGTTGAPEQAWHDDLSALHARLRPRLPAPAVVALENLLGQDEAVFLALADRLMGLSPLASDLALAPIAVAALQLAWTRQAAALKAETIAQPSLATRCPVCGGLPVAGVIHVGMSAGGRRYLHCGICGTAWHHVRASCVACGDGRDVNYRMIEDGNDAVRAETCDACHSYLKILLPEKAPDFDPLADDLASVGLDLLIGEEGYLRIGANPFLLQAGGE